MALTQNANVGLLNQTTTSTSFAVPTPTGFAAGDLLFCVLNVDSKSATVTAPSGWTLDQDIQTSLALGNRTRTYYKFADGSEGGSQTWTISVAQRGSGTMLGFSGADTVKPVDVKATQNNSTSSTSQVAPSLTPTVTGGILVCSASAFINGSYTPPGGMTEQSDQANVDTTTTVATLSGLTTAATGAKTFTASTSSGSITTSSVIRPAQTTSANVPVGTAAGDLLFAQIYAANQGGGVTLPAASLPAGWTQIDSLALNAALPYIRLTTAYRVADGSEPASYSFGVDGSTTASALMRKYAGPWASPPLDVHSTQQNASSTSASAASVTVTAANSLAVMSVAQAGANTVTPPSGFSAGANGSLATGYRHDLLENSAVAAGATGTVTATLAAAAYNEAFLAIFTPGAAGTIVSAPVLTGSGLAPVPSLLISSTLAAPVLTGSGALLAAVPKLTLGAPILSGSGALLVPGLSLSSSVAAPVLTGSGLMPVPTLLLSLTVAAPVLSGSGAMASPNLLLSQTMLAPVLSGSGVLNPGAPGLILSAPALAGSGSILDGSIALSQVIQAAVLRGAGVLNVPQLVILTPLPGWGIVQAREPFALIADASLKGAAMADGQPFGLIVAIDPSGQINRGEPFALIVDVSPQGKES